MRAVAKKLISWVKIGALTRLRAVFRCPVLATLKCKHIRVDDLRVAPSTGKGAEATPVIL